MKTYEFKFSPNPSEEEKAEIEKAKKAQEELLKLITVDDFRENAKELFNITDRVHDFIKDNS